MVMCGGKFNRTKADCAVCSNADACRVMGVCDCYGYYSLTDAACIDCPLAIHCKGAEDIPEITRGGELADSADPEYQVAEMHPYSVIFNRLMAVCDNNPVRVAVVISRCAGAEYDLIGRLLGISKQAVAAHVAAIKQDDLRRYLLAKPKSKSGVAYERIQEIVAKQNR